MTTDDPRFLRVLAWLNTLDDRRFRRALEMMAAIADRASIE